MSHVTTVDIDIRDLDALADAAKRCGLELKRDQKTYRWWGHHVGDYPLPQGFQAEDLGKCEHAIGVPGNGSAYEIGVVRRRDGRPGYTLIYDFYGEAGAAVERFAGPRCNQLKQAYTLTVARNMALRQGFSVTERQGQHGAVQLVCTKA